METSRQLLFLSTTSLATRQQCSSLLGPISSTPHEILAHVCMTGQGHGRANMSLFALQSALNSINNYLYLFSTANKCIIDKKKELLSASTKLHRSGTYIMKHNGGP